MTLRKAKEAELEKVIHLYKQAVKTMNQNGITQWDTTYPNREILWNDLQQGHLYIYEEQQELVGAVVLNEIEDPQYSKLVWEDQHALVIHRFAVSPQFQGKGIAKKMLSEIEQLGKHLGYTSIRLDTYSLNPIALRLYIAVGYQKRGTIYFPPQVEEFICFEKLL